MGSHERASGERLRLKYARAFSVPLSSVVAEEFIDALDREDVRVFAPGYNSPVWTVGPRRE